MIKILDDSHQCKDNKTRKKEMFLIKSHFKGLKQRR